MGRSAGACALVARVQGIAKPLEVHAHATASRAANLSFDDAPPAKGAPAGTRRLVAVVADIYGNPVPDSPVTFTARSGTVSPARAVTDAHGRVTLAWRPSGTVSEQRLQGAVRGTDVAGAYTLTVGGRVADAPVAAKAKRGAR
jgi:hypothetical protein